MVRASTMNLDANSRVPPGTKSHEAEVIAAVLLTSLFFALFPAVRAGELTITRVFGPEVPTGPYKHPASMTELKNGDLYLVYYGGAGEYAIETAVFGSRLETRRDKMERSQADRPRPVPLGR